MKSENMREIWIMYGGVVVMMITAMLIALSDRIYAGMLKLLTGENPFPTRQEAAAVGLLVCAVPWTIFWAYRILPPLWAKERESALQQPKSERTSPRRTARSAK